MRQESNNNINKSIDRSIRPLRVLLIAATMGFSEEQLKIFKESFDTFTKDKKGAFAWFDEMERDRDD